MKESKPQGHPFSAPTPDNLKRVGDTTMSSPCSSAQWQALTLQFNKFVIHQIFHKDLCYYPYKIQVAQELSEQDKVSRLQFFIEFLDLVKNNINLVNTLLMSDKAHFHVSGYVNKQNCCYWAPNNPHELHQCLLVVKK